MKRKKMGSMGSFGYIWSAGSVIFPREGCFLNVSSFFIPVAANASFGIILDFKKFEENFFYIHEDEIEVRMGDRQSEDRRLNLPPGSFCSENAVMIAFEGERSRA
ncbi:MAG: hypothetical protein P8Y75_11725 [Nitrospirota bacterium]